MRAVVQRVLEASVTIDEKLYSSINKGYLIYIAFTQSDSESTVRKMCEKIINLRVFEDDTNKLNLNIGNVIGEILLVSQFTLYGDTKGNNRPSFTKSANRDLSIPLYEMMVYILKEKISLKTGVFGADMKVHSINDGPVTIIIEME